MPSNHLILCHPLLLLPSVFPSIRVFFNESQLFTSCGHSIGTSASVSVLPMNIQGWFPLGLTSLISLLSRWLSKVFSRTTIWKHQFFGAQPSLWSNSHICTPRYFIIFWCNGKWDCFLKFSFWYLLLVYILARDFHILILYPATLPCSLMSSSSFLIASLGFSMYTILLSVKSDKFTSPFPI